MSLKTTYKSVIKTVERVPGRIETLKTIIAEDISIAGKKKLYSNIVWSAEQQNAFDNFWIEAYGQKIPNYWHKLYQLASGKFCVDYMPEKLYTTKIEPKMNDRLYVKALEDKSLVEIISRNCDCVVPETVLVCSAGRFCDGNRAPITKCDAIQLLKKEKNIVIKPSVGSSSGKNVRFIDSFESLSEIELLINTYGKDFVVQKKVIQHPDFAKFNPSSLNTIRITTYIVNGVIHHVPLAFRIGRSGKNVDNIHAGGIGIGVQDDGALNQYAFNLGYGNKTVKFEKHPDSGIVFADSKLPLIDRIISSAYSVHKGLPHLRIVSWDYSVDADSNPVLIEANLMGQGIWFPQMIHGKGAFGENTAEVLKLIRK